MGEIIALIIVLTMAIWIGKDANKRGMNGNGWGIFTFLFNFLAVAIYFMVRKPKNL